MIKTSSTFWVLLLASLLLLSGCGYYFPHDYQGPRRVIYAATWNNRTNKLNLDMRIYQSLSRWFQKTQSIDLTKEKTGADYILAGEVISIDLPTVSWSSNSSTSGTKVSLYVRYSLKDLKTGKVVWEVNRKLYTADSSVQVATAASDDEALGTIIEDMSENIYLGVLKKLRQNPALPAN